LRLTGIQSSTKCAVPTAQTEVEVVETTAHACMLIYLAVVWNVCIDFDILLDRCRWCFATVIWCLKANMWQLPPLKAN